MNTHPSGNEPAALSGMDDVARQVKAISEENDRLFRRLLEGEQHFRRLAKAVWKVQEEERRRLALELHDGIGQTLTALKNYLQQQRARCTDPQMLAGIDAAFALAATALHDTRELSRLLRPPVLDDLGLQAALQWLARIQRERAGLDVTVKWELDVERLDSQLETLVFRAVQEALTNAARHADTASARVSVGERAGNLQVLIEDEGKGFDTTSAFQSGGDGFGLRGLRDRVELFGGRVGIASEIGKGTTVRFVLPLNGTVAGDGKHQ